jgi:predicted O-methyltransferase YrrM
VLQDVIDRLEAMPKQGESYDHKGRHGWANPIRQDTGPLLEALVLARNPKRVLEIGTAHGLSGCYIARRLGSEGTMVSIEWDETRAKEAQANFDEAELAVTVICGDAMKIIETFNLTFPFDMVFMDANKDGYLEQIEKLAGLHLLAPDCLIVADNVIDRQKECQNFLDMMQKFPHIILQTECGLLVGTI